VHGRFGWPATLLAVCLFVLLLPSAGLTAPTVSGQITHVVILYQENDSFDEILGGLCIRDERCDGASSGRVSTGQVIPLRTAPDIVPGINHSILSQTTAIDGGLMDRFDLIKGCAKNGGYACYAQYTPEQIPNLAALARTFTISDRTFEEGPTPSWGSHLVLVASNTDGFTGDNPHPGAHVPGPGWGCNSFKDAPWLPPGGGSPILVPSCVPAPDGSGPYRPSPVQWEPTIMDRFDAAGLSWQIDAGFSPKSMFGTRAICPFFAECLYGPQSGHVRFASQVITDGKNGTLPNLSLVMPCCGQSEHNGESMTAGDNWIGQVLSAIMQGPQWGSTAVFITWDDCGCFYDHVPPPPGLGIRVPMVIVSPYAKQGYTDSNVASFDSMLAFIEHTFNLAPLGLDDAAAYDYLQSFNFLQRPLGPIPLRHRPLPPGEAAWLKAHPPDPNDPT
jgi:phospholipase C